MSNGSRRERWTEPFLTAVLVLFVLGLVFAAGFAGWAIGHYSAKPGTRTVTVSVAVATTQAPGGGNPVAGKQVFASAGCAGCHTLKAAGSTGTTGTNLDKAKPSLALVLRRVTIGFGTMPSFKDQLSQQQIRDVAAFVVQSTR
jgi:mono/diheme cytochrome c family protein